MDNIFDDMLNELNQARDEDKGLKQQREIREAVERYRQKQKAKKRPMFEAQAPQMFYEMMEETATPEPTPEPSYFREPEPELVVEEVRDTRSNIEKASDWIAHSKKEEVKTDPQSIREGYDITERVRLLEQDLFRVQSQAKPQTLVAGIGASLDSGGGAVWLWDLEDVNIGVPVDGQYPSISDGQSLVYDLATNKWIPGAGSGGGGFDGDITAQFLEFDGVQEAQAIRVSGATNKQFDIEVGETKETAGIVARFEPEKLTLPNGTLAATTVNAVGGTFSGTTNFADANVTVLSGNRRGLVYKLIAGTGLTFEGQLSTHIGGTDGNDYNTNVGTIGVNDTVLQTTGNQTIIGNKVYRGSTAEILSLQTKQSVEALITAGGGGLNFNFIGDINVTATDPPTGVSAGDYYINNTAGNAGANWTGIATEPIALNQLVIYTSADEWATGAEVDVSQYVPLAGTTAIVGDLQSTKDFITTGGQFSVTTSTANHTCYKVTQTGSSVPGDLTFTIGGNGDLFTYGKITGKHDVILGTDASDDLTVNSTATFASPVTLGAQTTASAKIVPLNDGTIDLGGTNFKWQGIYVDTVHSGAINASGNLVVTGATNLNGNIVLGDTSSDVINFNARANNDLIPIADNQKNLGSNSLRWLYLYTHKVECGGTSTFGGAATFNGNVTLGSDSNDAIDFNGQVHSSIVPSSNIYILGSDSNPWGNIYVDDVNAGDTITSDKFVATGTNSISQFKGGTFSKQLTSSFKFEQSRSNSSGTNYFQLDGKRTSSGSTDILFEAVSGGSNDADTVKYYGPTNADNNAIQTKASTEAMIDSKAITPGTWAFVNSTGGTGSTLNGYYLVEYYKNSDEMVTIMVHADDSDNIAVGDVVCKLPSGYRPGTDAGGMVWAPIFQLVNSNSATAIATCMVKSDGSIVFIEVNGFSKKFYGQCTFTTRTTA